MGCFHFNNSVIRNNVFLNQSLFKEILAAQVRCFLFVFRYLYMPSTYLAFTHLEAGIMFCEDEYQRLIIYSARTT
jgi:hypothetical protein